MWGTGDDIVRTAVSFFTYLLMKCLRGACWWALEVQWVMYCQGNPRAGVFIMTVQPLLVLASQAEWLGFADIGCVTHGVHLLFKSSGFDSLQRQQLEPACSKGDAWGRWSLLLTLACQRSSCRDAEAMPCPGTAALLPTPSALCGGPAVWF